MKCDACGNAEASVFLTKIVDGKMQKVNLCSACAKAKGSIPSSFHLENLLSGIGSSVDLKKSPKTLKCEVCGFTQTELKKTARLGCSNCYSVFPEILSSMIKSMHKGTSHLGKCPSKFKEARENQAKLSYLENELKSAIESEAFERAAEIRDQINLLLSPSPTADHASR